jgi:hypothetical protein
MPSNRFSTPLKNQRIDLTVLATIDGRVLSGC